MNYFFKRYDTREILGLDQSTEKTGALVLREAVLEFLKDPILTDKDIVVCHDAKGKPSIKIKDEDSPLSISLSHKDYWTTVGVGQQPCSIGVDVEKIRSFSKILAEGFLCPEELVTFRTCTPSESAKFLTVAWSYKECVMKAFGLGLRVHPQRINVSNLIYAKQGETAHFLLDNEEVPCIIGYCTLYDGYVFIGISVRDNLPVC